MSTSQRETTAQAPEAQSGDWRAGVRRSGGKQLLVLLVTAVLVALGAYLVGNHSEGSKGSTLAGGAQAVQPKGDASGPAPEVGKPAPDFVGRTTDGKAITLSALKGKPVWLVFGASWCTACRAEAPDIQSAYTAAAPKGVQTIAVAMQEMPADVQAYAQRVGLTYPQVADPDETLSARYRIVGLPSHIFIDKDGIVRSIHVGALTRPAMDQEIAKLG